MSNRLQDGYPKLDEHLTQKFPSPDNTVDQPDPAGKFFSPGYSSIFLIYQDRKNAPIQRRYDARALAGQQNKKRGADDNLVIRWCGDARYGGGGSAYRQTAGPHPNSAAGLLLIYF